MEATGGRSGSAPVLVAALTASLVLLVLAGRQVLLELVGLFEQVLVLQRPATGLRVVGSLAVALFLLALVRFVAERCARGVRRGAGLAAAAALLGLVALHHHHLTSSIYGWGFANPRVVGRFPFDGGSERVDTRGGRTTVAHMLADGTRACGSTPSPDAFVVALVGDSFVFGSGVADEETVCWQLRERLAALDARPWHLVNLGQPGAALHSSLETARFATADHGADVIVLSILPEDDVRAFDLNDAAWLVGQRWFRLLGAAFDPEALFLLLNVGFEMVPPDGYGAAAFRAEARRAAALAHTGGVPVVTYVGQGAGVRDPVVGWYDEVLQALADEHFLPQPPFFPPDDPPGSMYIPGDGHPTAANNANTAEVLAPVLGRLRGGGP